MHGAACCSVLQCVAVEVVGKEEDEETAIQNIRMCVAVQCVAMCCRVCCGGGGGRTGARGGSEERDEVSKVQYGGSRV